ncbi:MAG: chorismate synthase [Chlamydiota bacterium]
MASNTFGNLFKITTWGESHGKAIGVVIDGCPAGLPIENEDVNKELVLRAPGKSPYTTSRSEKDQAEILSGVFEGKTTGAPISIIIYNRDADSSKYEPIKHLMRPGHSNHTYLEKYGIFDYRGGGRASARETACRVAAGAVAKKILAMKEIACIAYLDQVGSIRSEIPTSSIDRNLILSSPLYCPDPEAENQIIEAIEIAKIQGDSLGGGVAFIVKGVPVGLGDPVYEKIDANIAKAMMSIPATKGVEIGSGFSSIEMVGSEHNDQFRSVDGTIITETNYAGGSLGGISNGMFLEGRVAFKPTSSIMRSQKTVDEEGNEAVFNLPSGSRHDPCVSIRAVPVVEAMLALVLVDSLLMNKVVRW